MRGVLAQVPLKRIKSTKRKRKNKTAKNERITSGTRY